VFLWGPFPSHFLFKNVLDDDVHHINAFPRLGDVQVAFGIFIHFMQKPYNLFHYFRTLPDFQCQLAPFDLTFIRIFGRLLRPSFLECPEASLVRQQTSLPISRGGIGHVFTKIIALAMYLGSWRSVTLIIASKFL
jgi:hypothetical protein